MKVPLSLILSPAMPPCTKVLWMALHLPAAHQFASDLEWLEEASALSRPTVRKWLPMVQSLGPFAGPAANLPADLLAHEKIGSRAKVLYGALQATPGFRTPAGRFTYLSMSHLAHADPKMIRLAIGRLIKTGWIKAAPSDPGAPIHFTIHNPGLSRAWTERKQAQRRLRKAKYKGEAIMREFLSLLIAIDQFMDDAAPGFLINPVTQERLQFDRFYPPKVAFEYNGAQHYEETDLSSAEELARQQGRDLIKRGICHFQGITLVTVHAEDLSLAGMQAKVGNLLRLKDLTGREPLIQLLEKAGARYRHKAANPQ